MELKTQTNISPEHVHKTLGRHLLADGMPMVLDMDKSHGVYLYDQRTGREFVDFFGFFASNPLGMNHPKLTGDDDFKHRLMQAALNKVTNSDVYTEHIARFVDTFSRVGIPDYLPHAFFVSGGALAVENALKAAFDWKVRRNFKKGYRREVGHQVMHFEHAFHGRSGYTLSLTNTDPTKTKYFPKFDWPRVYTPKANVPLTEGALECVEEAEAMAVAQMKRHFHDRRDDIACIILEPIQGEGGDNHFRPEFLRTLRDLADENDVLLVFDEVQTGVGITGKFWAHQVYGVRPDILSFGKKTQVCGILAGKKLDEVEGNVFETSSRINSTWGGNLVDMVRFDRILEVIEEDNLVEHAGRAGAHLQKRLQELSDKHETISNPRGEGLFCAFDLPNTAFRNAVTEACYEKNVVILGCGPNAIRFRPPLTITEAELDEGLSYVEAAVEEVAAKHG